MTILKRYQLEGARQIRRFRGRALLADEMGLGKSLQALFYCFKMKRSRPVVLVCPASLKINWEREASKHLNMASEVLSGRKPPRRVMLEHPPILIINYEILHHWVEYLIELRPQVVIFDEAHWIQNRDTLRFRSMKRLMDGGKVPYRIAISGTPLTSRPADLWPTLHLLRPDKFKSFTPFGFKYCKPKLVRGKWEFVGAQNLDKLHARLLKLCMIRRRKVDVASELPPKLRRMTSMELSPKSMMEYNFASDRFIPWLKKRYPTRVYRAKKNPHLTRIGYLLRLVAKLKRHKVLDWIHNFSEESDGKLVVFSCHTKMVDWLHSKFPHSSVIINGKVSGKKRQRAIDQFNDDPRCRFAFCHPKSAGVGLNMISAADVLFCDFPWTPGVLKQGEDRVHRLGQTKRCTIWYLIARYTIEEALCQLLHDKQDILDAILDGKKVDNDFDIFEELINATTKKKGLLAA